MSVVEMIDADLLHTRGILVRKKILMQHADPIDPTIKLDTIISFRNTK